MLLMASKSLFNDILRIHHSRWPSSSEVPEPNYLHDCTPRASGDLMTLFTPVTKLLSWQNDIIRKNMNACVRVYISPFSQCQCWLFLFPAACLVCSLQLVQDRVSSGLSCHLSSFSETWSSKNINCGQRIEWKKQAKDKNVFLGSKKTTRETMRVKSS